MTDTPMIPADEAAARVAAAYEAAAQKARSIDAKAFRARYIVDRKGRQRWDEVQVRGCENKVMNIISEDITDAIRALTPDDALAALAKMLAEAEARGMRKAAGIVTNLHYPAFTGKFWDDANGCEVSRADGYEVRSCFGTDSYSFQTIRLRDAAVIYDGDDLPAAMSAAHADRSADAILAAAEKVAAK